jgi:CubicO group peptidase (beta-lactamase class C family)
VHNQFAGEKQMHIKNGNSFLSKRKLISIFLIMLFSVAAFSEETDSLKIEIDALMEKTFDADGPGATVIVTKDGKSIFTGAYGMADIELGVKMRLDHIFPLASVTKQFTGVAIMILVEQGKLALDDEITKYFPDYPVLDNKVTIRHLLTHTSGIQDYMRMEGFLDVIRDDFTVEGMIDYFKDQPFNFKPGEQFGYSNSAYYLLGAIIEKISGITYGDFLDKNIFEPLSMTNSHYVKDDQIIKNRVSTYTMGEGELGIQNASYFSDTIGYSAGALESTVADLAKWDAALYTDKLISQEGLKQCQTSYVLNDGTKTEYGFGLGLNNLKGHKYYTHTGGFWGIDTTVSRFPDEKIFVAVLLNTDSAKKSSSYLRTKISAIALGDPMIEPKIIDLSELSEEELKRIVGKYRAGKNDYRVISLEEGKLYSEREPFKDQIFPVSATHFAIENSFNTFDFLLDENGNVIKMVLNQTNGNSTSAPKEK